jgi:hypothetical protein
MLRQQYSLFYHQVHQNPSHKNAQSSIIYYMPLGLLIFFFEIGHDREKWV